MLLTTVVVSMLLLAGCTGGLNKGEAVEQSAAVDSVNLTTVDGEFGDKLILNLTLQDGVMKNDETCTTQFNPATKTSRLVCNDNWHQSEITGVTVTHNGTSLGTYDATNVETVSVNTEWRNGKYRFLFHSENAPDTWFEVTVSASGEPTIESAGYRDDY